MTSHRGANPDIQDIGASLPGRDGITVREMVVFLEVAAGRQHCYGQDS